MENPDQSGLFGAWQLTAAYVIVQGSGERRNLYGEAPRGHAVLERSGRMVALLTSSNRQTAEADIDKITLFQSMMSYSGMFSIDDEKFVTKVDLAWDPSWEGTDQTRYYVLLGDSLSLRTGPIEHPAFPGQTIVAYVDWVRRT